MSRETLHKTMARGFLGAMAAVWLMVLALAMAEAGADTKRDTSVSGQFRSIDSGVYVSQAWTCVITQGDEAIAGGTGPVLTLACFGPPGLRAGKVWGGCPAAGTGQPWGLSPLGQYLPDTQFELISIPIGGVLQARIAGEPVTLMRVATITPPSPNWCGFSPMTAPRDWSE